MTIETGTAPINYEPNGGAVIETAPYPVALPASVQFSLREGEDTQDLFVFYYADFEITEYETANGLTITLMGSGDDEFHSHVDDDGNITVHVPDGSTCEDIADYINGDDGRATGVRLLAQGSASGFFLLSLPITQTFANGRNFKDSDPAGYISISTIAGGDDARGYTLTIFKNDTLTVGLDGKALVVGMPQGTRADEVAAAIDAVYGSTGDNTFGVYAQNTVIIRFEDTEEGAYGVIGLMRTTPFSLPQVALAVPMARRGDIFLDPTASDTLYLCIADALDQRSETHRDKFRTIDLSEL